jgi:hypothetical protein
MYGQAVALRSKSGCDYDRITIRCSVDCHILQIRAIGGQTIGVTAPPKASPEAHEESTPASPSSGDKVSFLHLLKCHRTTL